MDELLYRWWRLRQLPGIGNVALATLRSQLSAPQDLPDLDGDDLCQLGFKAEAVDAWLHDPELDRGFEQLLQWQQVSGQGVWLAGTDDYPAALNALSDAPCFLFWRGDPACLNRPAIAMVGSRNPTPYGRDWGFHTAAALSEAGLLVVSGLALGIDGAVHSGALSIDSGHSVAVLAGGADVIYPKRHRALYQSLCQQGLILAESLPGTAPQGPMFPARNRIISGLSMATVVVEAAVRSGSLITARQAAAQGREVMALPGVVTNPLSHGCHQLIQEGATLVQDAEDIILALGLPDRQPDLLAGVPDLAQQQAPALLSCIDFTPTPVDVIAIRSSRPVSVLQQELLMLELDGWLVRDPGGYRRLR